VKNSNCHVKFGPCIFHAHFQSLTQVAGNLLILLNTEDGASKVKITQQRITKNGFLLRKVICNNSNKNNIHKDKQAYYSPLHT
jgi:hypothetical protein